MPRHGHKSLTIRRELYSVIMRAYSERRDFLEKNGVESVSKWVDVMIADFLKDGKAGIEHIRTQGKVMRVLDMRLHKTVPVSITKDAAFCLFCISMNCRHSIQAKTFLAETRSDKDIFQLEADSAPELRT